MGKSYAIRIHRLAAEEMELAQERIATFIDENYAAKWYQNLREFLASLATFPHRYSIAKENRLFQAEVRSSLYRHTPSSAVYLVLFSIMEPEDDASYVHILHIRHAARKPMTRAEARKIEADI